MNTPLDAAALEELAAARAKLEAQSLALRLSALVGSPLEKGLRYLPAPWRNKLDGLAHDALGRAMGIAARSLVLQPRASPRLHKVLGSVSGGAGGAFGLPGLALEIPVSTVLIMRAILATAREAGEDIDDPPVRLAALEVFALGGPGSADDSVDTGYYAVRAALAGAVSEATRHVASSGLAGLGERGAPAIARLIALVAARYKVQLTQKAASMVVPGLGAAAGVAVNLMFMSHFQAVSEGHFAVRRLERHHGAEVVRAAYQGLGAGT